MQTRRLQRALHLLAGLAVVAYIYASPQPGSALATVVKYLIVPVLAASGILMWQLPRLRRMRRRMRTLG